jgi:2-oxoglutarate dehydrogenase E2 component (dihydrolipoamide succinyltransferase)
MAEELKIPPFGESITTANVSRWLKSDGDFVKKGEALVSLETDKVSQDLESPSDGTLKILVQEDEEVDVGTVIAEIDESAEAPSNGGDEKSQESSSSPEAGDDTDKKEGQSTPTQKKSSGEVREVKIPPFGESITSASLAEWKVASGDHVAKGQTLASLETDKISQDLEAEVAGTIETLVEEGDEIEIGAVIAKITEGEGAASEQSQDSGTEEDSEDSEEKSESAPTSPAKREASPSAPADRVKPDAEALKQSSSQTKEPKSAETDDDGRVTRKKMSMLRRKIAQHLVNAQQTAAILTTFNEVDMSGVMSLRKDIQDEFVAKHGVKLGFMSLFTKAVVLALKENPGIRSFIEGNEIIENNFYDIGIAVGTEKGLVVPVIRDCDEKSFADIEKAIGEAAQKAKDGSLQIDDLQGGIFTISNGGVYGSLLSTPILNPPQSGILGMHTIQQRPMAVDGEVKIRPMMYLALSYDHRIVDGKEGVTFLIKIKELLENPSRLLLEC